MATIINLTSTQCANTHKHKAKFQSFMFKTSCTILHLKLSLPSSQVKYSKYDICLLLSPHTKAKSSQDQCRGLARADNELLKRPPQQQFYDNKFYLYHNNNIFMITSLRASRVKKKYQKKNQTNEIIAYKPFGTCNF